MELNERLVALRKKRGLSQAELAEAIKVSRQAISRWEVGTAIPSADNLMWLSKFYEVSMDELMGAATDDKEQGANEKQQVTTKRPEFSKKIAIVLCAIAVFIGVTVWIVLSIYKGKDDVPVSIGELDSYNLASLEIVDENLGEEKN